jgi:hypothetical protein
VNRCRSLSGGCRPATLLVAVAGCVLALGVLVYMTDRDPARAQWWPRMASLATGPIFGAAGQWLPSFVHPFAFSLFTAAALPRAAAPAYAACAAWWAVNVAFEAGQQAQVSAWLADTLPRVLGDNRLAQALSSYFVLGTFDAGDVAAAAAGALAAAGVLHIVHQREHRHAS